jgi:hypothetical protein
MLQDKNDDTPKIEDLEDDEAEDDEEKKDNDKKKKKKRKIKEKYTEVCILHPCRIALKNSFLHFTFIGHTIMF